MRVEKAGARIDYESERIDSSGPAARFRSARQDTVIWPLKPA
jgi:hypothetical protein